MLLTFADIFLSEHLDLTLLVCRVFKPVGSSWSMFLLFMAIGIAGHVSCFGVFLLSVSVFWDAKSPECFCTQGFMLMYRGEILVDLLGLAVTYSPTS